MTSLLARLPLLFVGAGLTLWGAAKAEDQGLDLAAWALMGAGLVCLGAWAAVEVMASVREREDRDDGEPRP